MSYDYRKPGVYADESLFVGSGDTASASSVALFVGVSAKGPTDRPVFCQTWTDYVASFGGFNNAAIPNGNSTVLTYLPYSVYSYFQNGGKPTWVMRASASNEPGTAAYKDVTSVPTITNKTISDVAITSNVATLTTSTAHGFTSGKYVIITGCTGNYTYLNGVWLLTAASGSTFSFDITHANVVTGNAPTGTPKASQANSLCFRIASKSVGSNDNGTGTGSGPFTGVHFVITKTGEVVTGTGPSIYTLVVFQNGVEVERFQHLTISGADPGTRSFATAINDSYTGSRFITILNQDTAATEPDTTGYAALTALENGTDPGLATGSNDLIDGAIVAVDFISGPLMLNLVPFLEDQNDPTSINSGNTVLSSSFPDRNNIFIIHDGYAQRPPSTTPSTYKGTLTTNAPAAGDSYVATYAPWVVVPNPLSQGSITIPPGGVVAGVFSRTDAQIGVFQSPAGILASTNALGVDTTFSDADLGELNSSNINVLRPMQGVGVCIMGARTRKVYGVDRYVAPRRTLIYLKETLKRSTEFALFENNDQRLWSQLSLTADRILRPLWELGGLRGESAAQAYYIRCDETNNTPAVISAGEVRLEIGVALEYPAEFIVIHITQFERASTSVTTTV